MVIASLHDGPSREVSEGHIEGVWRDLGREVGSRSVGLRLIQVEEGAFTTPAHEHGRDEEVFFVLGGGGVLWQEGTTCALAAGDCVVHLPKTGAHTLRGGAAGLEVLVFGQRLDAGLTALPRAGVAWSFPRWVPLGAGDPPFRLEAAVGPPSCSPPLAERPQHVVALGEVAPIRDGRLRRLAAHAGALATGLNHVTLGPGEQGAPLHCHSHEEELFVVLEGDGVLELLPGGEETPQEHSLGAGAVVSRLPGSGVAHSLRAGEGGLTYLAYGTREPGDMCFYPETGRVSLRGLGIALRSPEIDYLPRG